MYDCALALLVCLKEKVAVCMDGFNGSVCGSQNRIFQVYLCARGSELAVYETSSYVFSTFITFSQGKQAVSLCIK